MDVLARAHLSYVHHALRTSFLPIPTPTGPPTVTRGAFLRSQRDSHRIPIHSFYTSRVLVISNTRDCGIMSTISHSLRDQKEPNRQQAFTHSFALPDGQVPFNDIPAVLSLSNPGDDDTAQEDEVYAGRLTLTEKFLCFESMDRRSCREALPLYCVRRVERLNTKRSGVFALAVVVWHGMRIVCTLLVERR